jgi:sodium/bile acid cotransporter 7
MLAALWPNALSKQSPLRTDISSILSLANTVGYVVTALIFFLSGIAMPSKTLQQAFIHWKLILLIQFISLGFIPLVSFGLQKILNQLSFDPRLSKGIVVACSTPTTIASNVLMTKQAGGNEAAALVNAVVGNVIGIFISPLLIISFLALVSNGTVSYSSIFLKLTLTVIIPLILGQIVRFVAEEFVIRIQNKSKSVYLNIVNLSYVNSTLLLLIVWSVLCDSFSSKVFSTVPALQTFLTCIICETLFITFSFISFSISKFLSFNIEDSIATVFCSATKTVALGIPLINVIFSNDPDIGLVSLPLLIYHALQLVTGSFMIGWFKKKTYAVIES